jgi:hypothetical protein
VVLKHSKEVGDFEQVVRAGEDPGAKDAQKALPLIGEHANRETSGIEVSSHKLSLVVVCPFKLVHTQRGRHQWVGGPPQHREEGPHTNADGMDDEGEDVSIKVVIDVHIVRWGQAGPSRIKDPDVDGVPVGGTKPSHFGSSGLRGK